MVKTIINNNPKIILFDIESTNLAANFGYIICISWKIYGEKEVHTVSITESPTFKRDPTNDKYVVETAAKALSEADMWVTWYGARFDVPFIQSRLIHHKIKPLPPIPHLDGWMIARKKLKLNSNRLASVTAFLELDDKTPLSGPIWIKAMSGHKASIKYVVEHCEQDVRVLEQVYEIIRVLSTSHPNIGIMKDKPNSCSVCGSQKLQSRGYYVAHKQRRHRFQCQNCSAWILGNTIPIKKYKI